MGWQVKTGQDVLSPAIAVFANPSRIQGDSAECPPAPRVRSHESPRTTKLYDRTGDQLSLDEIEKILI